MICLSMLLLASANVAAQQVPAPLPPPLGYVCYRTAAPLRIDGRLDEPAWRRAPWRRTSPTSRAT